MRFSVPYRVGRDMSAHRPIVRPPAGLVVDGKPLPVYRVSQNFLDKYRHRLKTEPIFLEREAVFSFESPLTEAARGRSRDRRDLGTKNGVVATIAETPPSVRTDSYPYGVAEAVPSETTRVSYAPLGVLARTDFSRLPVDRARYGANFPNGTAVGNPCDFSFRGDGDGETVITLAGSTGFSVWSGGRSDPCPIDFPPAEENSDGSRRRFADAYPVGGRGALYRPATALPPASPTFPTSVPVYPTASGTTRADGAVARCAPDVRPSRRPRRCDESAYTTRRGFGLLVGAARLPAAPLIIQVLFLSYIFPLLKVEF